eukprot:13512663-Alexandrium_andersonii.AAC.1
MSASLVGSEMCIRDSVQSRRSTWQQCSERARGWQYASEGAPFQGLGPVSYTHLTLPTICSV